MENHDWKSNKTKYSAKNVSIDSFSFPEFGIRKKSSYPAIS